METNGGKKKKTHKMSKKRAGSLLKLFQMFLGIITYLDTVKGFKIDYSAFSEGDTEESHVFSSVKAIIWGYERF